MGDVGCRSWNLLRPISLRAGTRRCLVTIIIRSKWVLIFFFHECDRPYRVITVIHRSQSVIHRGRCITHALTWLAWAFLWRDRHRISTCFFKSKSRTARNTSSPHWHVGLSIATAHCFNVSLASAVSSWRSRPKLLAVCKAESKFV